MSAILIGLYGLFMAVLGYDAGRKAQRRGGAEGKE